jgi:hypothetical protein
MINRHPVWLTHFFVMMLASACNNTCRGAIDSFNVNSEEDVQIIHYKVTDEPVLFEDGGVNNTERRIELEVAFNGNKDKNWQYFLMRNNAGKAEVMASVVRSSETKTQIIPIAQVKDTVVKYRMLRRESYLADPATSSDAGANYYIETVGGPALDVSSAQGASK